MMLLFVLSKALHCTAFPPTLPCPHTQTQTIPHAFDSMQQWLLGSGATRGRAAHEQTGGQRKQLVSNKIFTLTLVVILIDMSFMM